jgi:hypothetical protein
MHTILKGEIIMNCPYEKTSLAKCSKCQTEYDMPFAFCCLIECMEHEFCRGCIGPKILKGVQSMRVVIIKLQGTITDLELKPSRI